MAGTGEPDPAPTDSADRVDAAILESTFASLGDALFIVDPHTRIILRCNSAVESLFGYRPEEVVGRNTEFLHVDREAYLRFGEKLFPSLDAHGVFRTESRMRRKDGGVFLSAHTVTQILDAAGRRTGVVSLVRDVTRSRQAAEALRNSEQRLRRIVETAEEGIWVVDASHRTTFMNTRMAEMLGYAVEEVQGRSLFDFMDEEGGRQAGRLIERRRVGVRERHEFPFRRRDGTALHALVSASPFLDEQGGYEGALAMVTDITENKRAESALRDSERRFRVLFEKFPVGVNLVDLDGRPLYANAAMTRILGYSDEEMRGRHFTAWTHPADLGRSLDLVARLRAGEIGHFALEKRYVRKDGQVIWAHTSAAAVRGAGGEVEYYISMVQDITERVESQEKLSRLREELRSLANRLAEAQEAERKRISRELHDRVGQATSIICMHLDCVRTLLPEEVSDGILEHLDLASDSAEEVGLHVRDVMEDLRPVVLDDYGLVPAIREYAGRFTDRTGIPVEVRGVPDGARAHGDLETALFRIAQEAMTNIRKHAGATKVTVRFEAGERGLRMIIADDGRGFDPSAARALTAERGGLGLIGMRERAAAAGATFRVESRPGGGTRVVVEWPGGSNGR